MRLELESNLRSQIICSLLWVQQTLSSELQLVSRVNNLLPQSGARSYATTDKTDLPTSLHPGIISDMPQVRPNHLFTAGMIISGISTVACPLIPGNMALLSAYGVLYTIGSATWASLRTVVMGKCDFAFMAYKCARQS